MAPPKTILDKIIYAIRAQPPTHHDGPSRTAIVKYLQNEMDVDTKGKSTAIKNALKKGVEKGKLIQNGQRYRVVGDAIPEVAAEPEVKIEDIKEGSSSEMCDVGDTVVMKYEGKLDDGTIFDSSSNFEFTLGAGDVIKGWDKGILGMKIGGKRKLFVPAKLGYGKRGAPPEIPPNADLHFIVKLKKIK